MWFVLSTKQTQVCTSLLPFFEYRYSQKKILIQNGPCANTGKIPAKTLNNEKGKKQIFCQLHTADSCSASHGILFAHALILQNRLGGVHKKTRIFPSTPINRGILYVKLHHIVKLYFFNTTICSMDTKQFDKRNCLV